MNYEEAKKYITLKTAPFTAAEIADVEAIIAVSEPGLYTARSLYGELRWLAERRPRLLGRRFSRAVADDRFPRLRKKGRKSASIRYELLPALGESAEQVQPRPTGSAESRGAAR